MKRLLAAMAVVMTAIPAVGAFETATQAIIDRYKAAKRLAIADVAELMQASAQWCYDEQENSCAWTDIYLEVTDTGATYEIGNAWDAEADVAFTDHGAFMDDRYICETGNNWVPTVRATRRSDGTVIGGRELWELKQAIEQNLEGDTQDCFDYLYLSSDPNEETITLLQRQYTDGVHLEANDVEVTLHMDADEAADLTLRW